MDNYICKKYNKCIGKEILYQIEKNFTTWIFIDFNRMIIINVGVGKFETIRDIKEIKTVPNWNCFVY